MKTLSITFFIILNCTFLFANDADTIVTRSGKTYIGIAHHQTDKTVSITAFSYGEFNNVTFNIVRDSISKMVIDRKQNKARQLLESGGVYDSKDTTKQGLKKLKSIIKAKKGYWVSFNTDLINLGTLNPYVSLELFRRDLSGTSLILGFSYNLLSERTQQNVIYSFTEKNGNYDTRYKIKKNYMSIQIGVRKYFANSKYGTFYFQPQFNYTLHDVYVEYSSYFSPSYYYYYYTSNPILYRTDWVGIAFDGSLGYCFYKSKHLLINVDFGIKALNFRKGSLNYYFKNGLEIGVAF